MGRNEEVDPGSTVLFALLLLLASVFLFLLLDRLRRLDAACEQELPVGDRDDARIPDPQGLGHSRAA